MDLCIYIQEPLYRLNLLAQLLVLKVLMAQLVKSTITKSKIGQLFFLFLKLLNLHLTSFCGGGGILESVL
jgi:hypothetical protein